MAITWVNTDDDPTKMEIVEEVVRWHLSRERQPLELRELLKRIQKDRKFLEQEFGLDFGIVSCFLKETITKPGSGFTYNFDGQTSVVGLRSWAARHVPVRRRQVGKFVLYARTASN